MRKLEEISDENKIIMRLNASGKSTQQIANILGKYNKTTIARRLKRLTPRKTTEIYRELEADIIAEKKRQLLNQSVTTASPKEQRDLAVAWGIYADKELILRGQNPENRPLIVINQQVVNNNVGDSSDSMPKQGIEQSAQVIDITVNSKKD